MWPEEPFDIAVDREVSLFLLGLRPTPPFPEEKLTENGRIN